MLLLMFAASAAELVADEAVILYSHPAALDASVLLHTGKSASQANLHA